MLSSFICSEKESEQPFNTTYKQNEPDENTQTNPLLTGFDNSKDVGLQDLSKDMVKKPKRPDQSLENIDEEGMKS